MSSLQEFVNKLKEIVETNPSVHRVIELDHYLKANEDIAKNLSQRREQIIEKVIESPHILDKF